MERVNKINNECHSQELLLGISLIRFRKGMLSHLLNMGNKQMGDPRQQPSGMTVLCHTHGFTLIELLVVVLIIGILAAIALPQYQFIIYKTRLMSGVPLAKAIQQAQDVYFLEHGDWAASFEELGFSFPTGCSSFLGAWMRCGNSLYALSKHGAWGHSAFVSGQVKLAQLGCSARQGGYCGEIRFPYKGSHARWVYQMVDGVYCSATCGYGKQGVGSEYAHRICRSLAGGKDPVSGSDHYPM